MKPKHVRLRQEIYREDAQTIIAWLNDHEVIRYLNESQNVSTHISQAIERVNMPIMTHLFNQNGSFFIVCTPENERIGYLKLIHKKPEAEMVVVIGDREKWGQGLGTDAIHQGLKHAFFEWRISKVIARIHVKNTRSVHAFKKVGFQFEKELFKVNQYSITMDEFLKLA